MASKRGTQDRVYGGDACLIHIEDGKRSAFGGDVADYIDQQMRQRAYASGARTRDQAFGFEVLIDGGFRQVGIANFDLCPGCYMIALFNAAVALADRNGQSRAELGASMAAAFAALAKTDSSYIEEIVVVLDQ